MQQATLNKQVTVDKKKAKSRSLKRVVRRKPWKRYFQASQRRVKELIAQRDKARWARDQWCKEARRLGSKLGL